MRIPLTNLQLIIEVDFLMIIDYVPSRGYIETSGIHLFAPQKKKCAGQVESVCLSPYESLSNRSHRNERKATDM